MDYENDPYLDEDGEPLMDPDHHSDPEALPEPAFPVDDDLEYEGDWRRDRSPTPVLGTASEGKGGKPRKRLVKKGARESSPAAEFGDEGLNDWEDDEQPASSKKKLKAIPQAAASFKGGKGESWKNEKRKSAAGSKGDRTLSSGKGGSKGYGGGLKGKGDDEEIQEIWNTIAGGDSEDDQEGVRTVDDDNFIDDTGVSPADRFGSDNEGSPRHAPQAEDGEEDDEINKLFKGGKKKKKNEKSPAEIAMIVEHYMAEFEVTAEEDAEFNRLSKPAINKLRKLPMLVDVLSKKMLQQEFLKNWLEPLPDGSLPNMNIRTAVLKLLSDYPIDLEQYDRREQLKKSGLGKVIMFLSKSDEETTSNRKLAKELVDKWSRPIFNKSTRFEDMRHYDDGRAPYRRPSSQKQAAKTMESQDDDLDLAEFSQGKKTGQPARQHASRPEASPLDFVVRPQSKVDPEEVRARAKQLIQDPRRLKSYRTSALTKGGGRKKMSGCTSV